MEKSNRGWKTVVATEGIAYQFHQHLIRQQYSEYSIYRTLGYMHSLLVQNIVKDITGKNDIYQVSDVEHLRTIIRTIAKLPQDIKSHHMYSAAVRRYIAFIESMIKPT